MRMINEQFSILTKSTWTSKDVLTDHSIDCIYTDAIRFRRRPDLDGYLGHCTLFRLIVGYIYIYITRYRYRLRSAGFHSARKVSYSSAEKIFNLYLILNTIYTYINPLR